MAARNSVSVIFSRYVCRVSNVVLFTLQLVVFLRFLCFYMFLPGLQSVVNKISRRDK